MSIKPAVFLGDALETLRGFPDGARQDAGFQLDKVQRGEDPDDSKPMSSIQAPDEGAAMKRKTRFASIWDAIEDTPQQAASMRARSELLMALQQWARMSDRTQAQAARLLGITQPRMSDLMRGKISLFSLQALIDMASVAGLEPHVTLKSPKPLRKRREGQPAVA